MDAPLSRGRLSASFGSVRLGSAKVVFVGLVVLAGVISGCGDSKPAVPPLSIPTASLANGQMGTVYKASLSATGGTAPYQWFLRSGSLPAGLSLNKSSGAIAGTPTGFVYNSPLTFTVIDSSAPTQTQTVTIPLTIASGITVSVTPQNAGLTMGQTLALTVTANDNAGVTWSVSGSNCSGNACGTFSATTSLTGVSVNYTAPGTAGVYTITATSVTDKTVTATTTVGVTDLAGVATYHQNAARTGANTHEYALTPSNVSTSTFGKLFSCAVDGAIYAQPLWVPTLSIGGAKHNVAFVATQHDGLFAFDADASPCSTLWHVNLIDAAHGGTAGEVPVAGSYVGNGNNDIWPEIGVTGTPVIDLKTSTLYVVSKSMVTPGPSFYQRLHAIDLTTGTEKFSGPATIAGTYPGTGDGGSTTTFLARTQNQRAGLVLANGTVYIAWASHEDITPYYGWVMGYSAADLSQAPVVFNDSPNAGMSGIWMSGGAPAVDSAGNIYLASGNGKFDASNATAPNNDYGDSLMELSSSLQLKQYFTPSDQLTDENQDHDFGSGGTVELIDLPANGNNPTHLVLAGGKDGITYLVDRDNLGGYGDGNAWQEIKLPSGIFVTGAFWNQTYYVATINSSMQAYSMTASTGKMSLAPNAGTATFGFGSGIPTISSMPDNSNGILWALDNRNYCTLQSHGCGPTVLHALSASNLSTELWNSTQGTGNAAGNAVKFTFPTVANGKVYIGTRGNNTGGAENSSSTPGELDVYGLLP